MSVFRNLLFTTKIKISNKLPSEFQEVEYLQNRRAYRNSQYIDVGLDSNYDFSFEFELVSFDQVNVWIFGIDLMNGGYELGMDTRDHFYKHSSMTVTPSVPTTGQRYICNTTAVKLSTKKTVYIFTRNWPGEHFAAHMKLFNFVAKKEDKIVKKLVPCYRIADKKPGLYDVINHEFLTNISGTTDDFIVGPKV